jgi:glucosamine-6-phosphate deaminase
MLAKIKVDKLSVKVFESRASMGEAAAKEGAGLIRRILNEKLNANIVFASAPSQNEFLHALAGERDISWNRVNAFHMDEYLGLKEGAPQSFGAFLKTKLFDKLPFGKIHYINGNASDPNKECIRYAELLKTYEVDIAFMGIGENCHLAFNDPPYANFNDPDPVKIIKLDPTSRQQQVNDGCFETLEEVPTEAITLTLPALTNACYIICIVPGERKAKAVFQTLHEEINEKIPSSILRKHPNATLFIDTASASNLHLNY